MFNSGSDSKCPTALEGPIPPSKLSTLATGVCFDDAVISKDVDKYPQIFQIEPRVHEDGPLTAADATLVVDPHPQSEYTTAVDALFTNTNVLCTDHNTSVGKGSPPGRCVNCIKKKRTSWQNMHRPRGAGCIVILCDDCRRRLLPHARKWAAWLGLSVDKMIPMLDLPTRETRVCGTTGIPASAFGDRFWVEYVAMQRLDGIVIRDVRKCLEPATGREHGEMTCLVLLERNILSSPLDWYERACITGVTDHSVFRINRNDLYVVGVNAEGVRGLFEFEFTILSIFSAWKSHTHGDRSILSTTCPVNIIKTDAMAALRLVSCSSPETKKWVLYREFARTMQKPPSYLAHCPPACVCEYDRRCRQNLDTIPFMLTALLPRGGTDYHCTRIPWEIYRSVKFRYTL